MPTSLMKKVSDTCEMEMSKVEELWKKAKSQAQEQGHSEDGGYVTSIFKGMVGNDCKKKMGGNKNESKNIKEERDMSKTNEILNRINMILNEEQEDNKIDKEDLMEALRNAAEDIFSEVDEDKLEDIADAVMKRGDVKDTETAIQVAINMLRSEE